MIPDVSIHASLTERRQRLGRAMTASPGGASLAGLLAEVDAALERLEHGTYGLCETCHDPIEEDRLQVNPLTRFCLDHMTTAEQRALEQDLELAARIQMTLLPEPDLRIAGWDTAYHYAPHGPVSGDYCDLVRSADYPGAYLFMVGDVSGKGVAASMLMSHLHAMFRSLIGFGLPVGQLVERANRLFCESTLASHYATLVCGRAAADGAVEICNAGHCPPLLIHAGQVRPIESSGMPIGAFCTGTFQVQPLTLAPGDTLLLFTDGLTEAARDIEEYGRERLSRLCREWSGRPSGELLAAILDDHRRFLGESPRADDLTLLALRYTG